MDAATVNQEAPNSAVRAWLIVVIALIFAMIMVGGATRLTDSGLSITEWQPIMGAIPPLSAESWHEAFEKYRQIPEYKVINRGMSLEEFKAIFWWEWTHRFLGRFIGLVFFVPLVWFWMRGALAPGLKRRLLGVFVLGGLQGVLGWYMVMSGLVDRVDVSQYRLAAHLGLAVAIFGYLLWLVLDLRTPAGGRWRADPAAVLLAGFVFVQILLGALVAGLDAGQGYNTWPLMDGRWIPQGLFSADPWWINLFENAMTVQFDHRIAAYVVAVLAAVQAIRIFAGSNGTGRGSAGLLLAAVIAQIGLGVATLLAQAPIGLSLVHQAGAIVVFALAIWHVHDRRRPAEVVAS